MTADLNIRPNDDTPTFCYRHPTVETGLRCNNCGKYICSKCAMKTPVGYRCPDCIRNQQDVFFTINQASYAIAAVVAFALAIPAVFVLSKLGLFIVIFLGIPTGGFISEAVHRAIKRQRGRYTWLVVAVAVVLGGLAVTLFEVKDFLPLLSTPQFGDEAFTISDLLTLMAPGLIMTGLTAFTAAARFRYGK
jgi:hypothetical protein